MFNFFRKKSDKPLQDLTTDLHSHLIPGVDDGVQSMEESIELIRRFSDAGYKKVITTPHIMHDFYNNKEEDLIKIHEDVKSRIAQENIDITLKLAAEYYLDDHLNDRMNDPSAQFLTFGANYLLFETSFMNEPFYLAEFIFKAKSRGLNPVMAHPERYNYLHNDSDLLQKLIDRQVLFQLNINSLSGYYSKQVKKFAQKLIDEQLIHFAGSDCHNQLHFDTLATAKSSKYYTKLLDLPLLNQSI
ncbi:tyrosine-protein phosphatase [Fulvivirga lutea]|uniref:protein-tyrosine-phosphatase n=1 Tax=Fulvivirga lutea TaxID=2810512 RepID=A0A974WHT3_9BACT|nr:CpsB/CapC family capsule biosynthesis tyrosine phosphatase [Fulvivirga lutea]QSE97412.1 capsular biosynthesis protein [Fulvivirga lutea]